MELVCIKWLAAAALVAAFAVTPTASANRTEPFELSRAEFGPLSAGQTPVPQGLPRRWYGVIESSYITEGNGDTTEQKTFARATFSLGPGGLRSRLNSEYQYRPRGKLTASFSQVGGDCTWKGSGTVPLEPSHGVLGIIVVSEPGKKTRVEYGSYEGGPYDTQNPTIPVTVTCEGRTSTIRRSMHWLGVPAARKTRLGAQSLRGTRKYHPSPAPGVTTRGELTWCLTRKLADLARCPDEELAADPGGPYEVRRAQTLSLDGSGSTGDITRYRWAFERGADCPANVALRRSTKSGPKPTIVPLCSVEATLTVFDAKGKTDSKSTEIRVSPRTERFRTPDVKHTEKRAEDSRINDPPFVHGGEDFGDKNGGIVVGLNVASCVAGSKGTPYLCPEREGGTGLGKRYTVAQVRDPGGPFDGFSYVSSAPLTIERLGILNFWFLPGGPIVAPGQPNFYSYNKAQGTDVDSFIAAASAHEGMGLTGRLSTGHSGRLHAWISIPSEDPRRQIEARFARTASRLQADVDGKLGQISIELAVATREPLPEIWTGPLWFYDPVLERWVQENWSVP